MGFDLTRFANFKFAYFEIEESFGLIWVKLQNGRFYLQISIWLLKWCSFQVKALFLLILCIIGILGKFG